MTRYELRTHINSRARETGINDIMNDLINQTLGEIQMPGWAFSPRREHHYLWNFNRRKTTLTTVASQEDYELSRDLDTVGLIRQTTSPMKLIQVPDELFYRLIPNPTAEGNPRFYRLWEEVGTQVDLTVADTIDVVSNNAADSTSFTVSIVGYRDGIKTSEVLTLNGTTAVAGSITFDAGRPLRITKSGTTTGVITVTEHSGGTTILTLGKEERGARFKIISFYPIPSAEITINIEYFTRIRFLFNDSDEPDFNEKWHWVVEEGALAKVYEYKEDDNRQQITFNRYKAGVRGMIEADKAQYDLIDHLKSQAENRGRVGVVKLSDSRSLPNYGGGFGVRF